MSRKRSSGKREASPPAAPAPPSAPAAARRKRKEPTAPPSPVPSDEDEFAVLSEVESDAEAEEEEVVPSLSSLRDDLSGLTLKEDHEARPIWAVMRDGNAYVFLETFSARYKQAYDFLIAIADPLSRPEFVHEYRITKYSLYAAISLGLNAKDIVETLELMSKVFLPAELRAFVHSAAEKCGRVKLVLRKNRYFLESVHLDTLQKLAANARIAEALLPPAESAASDEVSERVDPETGFLVAAAAAAAAAPLELPGTASGGAVDQAAAMGITAPNGAPPPPHSASAAAAAAAAGAAGHPALPPVYSVEVRGNMVEQVKETCTQQLDHQMLEEYDFRRDRTAPDLDVQLKPSTQIREYQEKSLSKMFGNGRARSGIIVLPCGAGKTLVGITAMSTVRKSTLIFCTTGVAVHQWKRQIQQWAIVPDKNIVVFTSQQKDEIRSDSVIVITTYNMVAFNGQRSGRGQAFMDFISSHMWGLVLLDEVQVAPASKFRHCVLKTHSFCKLGLTATLVREDNKIDDLFFLIGPKLYEANWLDLQAAGHIATVRCVEVWCPMTEAFYRTYLDSARNERLQRLLYTMNPNKLRYCEYLIQKHEQRGDKVLVFCDSIFAMEEFGGRILGRPLLHGKTSDGERRTLLHHFQRDSNLNCLFISKVGDNSIDLPDVNVIIQISSHFAARRQEAQRLGRILRPKARTSSRFNAYFYTLVSKDTREMFYATKRQRFLVDQGYSFQVISDFERRMGAAPGLKLSTAREQLDLLVRVCTADSDGDGTIEEEELDEAGHARERPRKPAAKRSKAGGFGHITGDGDTVYDERKRKPGTKNKLRGQHLANVKKRRANRGQQG